MASFGEDLLVPLFSTTDPNFVAAEQGHRPVGAAYEPLPSSKWEDTQFPPSAKNVYARSPKFNSDGQRSTESNAGSTEEDTPLVWKRPEEFYQGNSYKLFEGIIEPNDINQGSLGNW